MVGLTIRGEGGACCQAHKQGWVRGIPSRGEKIADGGQDKKNGRMLREDKSGAAATVREKGERKRKRKKKKSNCVWGE